MKRGLSRREVHRRLRLHLVSLLPLLINYLAPETRRLALLGLCARH